jgi:putrescine transport system substrate-binding protein
MIAAPRLAVLALLLAAAGCGSDQAAPAPTITDARSAAEEPVVHFANFVDEIGPDTLAEFTRETGIKVVYDVYDANTMLDAKLLTGNTGYDVVVPGNNFLEPQIKAGIYQPLDRALLPNWRHLDPAILDQVAPNDPGNLYAVPYLFGTHALGYNVQQVRAVLGAEPPDSWSLLFDPANARRLQSCGITVPDSAWLMISQALRYLGRDPNSQSEQDLADAMRALHALRPYLRNITSQPLIDDYAAGQVCVFAVPSPDTRLARDQAAAAGTGVELHYIIPREGAILWFDMLAIPKDAPHPANAHKLIDFLLRPDVIAKITAATYLANANLGATPLVPAELRNDPLIYPDAEMMKRLQVNAAMSPDFSRKQSREYTRFKNRQ